MYHSCLRKNTKNSSEYFQIYYTVSKEMLFLFQYRIKQKIETP